MVPTKIAVKNFKAFGGWQELELRPMTLIFGQNNAGKSALLRVLPMLADAVRPNGNPAALDMATPALRGAAFSQLLWQGLSKDDERSMEIRVEWGEETALRSLSYTIKEWGESKYPAITAATIELAGEEPCVVHMTWAEIKDEVGTSPTTFDVSRDGYNESHQVHLSFDGLWPSGLAALTDVVGERFDAYQSQVLQVYSRVEWLIASRAVPQRTSSTHAAGQPKLPPDGRGAAAALTASKEAEQLVSSFYEDHFRQELRLTAANWQGESVRATLRPIEEPGYDIELVDCGEGVTQSFPVLTSFALSLKRAMNNRLLAIEEPESHLHPANQRALGEFFCNHIRENDDLRVVMETHSEQILLAVQLAVLRGHLTPDDVVIYWVEDKGARSVAERIELDEYARPSSPRFLKAFHTDTEMGRELVRLRREKED